MLTTRKFAQATSIYNKRFVSYLDATTLKNKHPELLSHQHKYKIIDVREPVEYQHKHLLNSTNIPLSTMDSDGWKKQVTDLLEKGENPELVIVHCKSGMRARKATEKFLKEFPQIFEGDKAITVVDGGIDDLCKTGMVGVEDAAKSNVWSIDRQVRFTAGSLVATGVALAATGIAPTAGLALSGFIGCGLVFSAVTDTCGMGMMLAKYGPWNKPKLPKPQ